MNPDNIFDCCAGLVSELIRCYDGWEGVKQFKGTPNRLVRMYQEFCWSPGEIQEELNKQFRVFENDYSEMLVAGPTVVWTLCPHHLLPVKFDVVIGCVPDGRVLGLSKFARVADILSRRPIMQEQYSTELADELMRRLQPKGVGISIKGLHGCMTSRGVKQSSPIVTSVLRGCFEEHPVRDEFYSIVSDLRSRNGSF